MKNYIIYKDVAVVKGITENHQTIDMLGFMAYKLKYGMLPQAKGDKYRIKFHQLVQVGRDYHNMNSVA